MAELAMADSFDSFRHFRSIVTKTTARISFDHRAILIPIIKEDMEAIRRGKNIFREPLWRLPEAHPRKSEQTLPAALLSFLETETTKSTFWTRWYLGFFTGHPIENDLQHRIALIPNKIWKAGPKAVAEEIARIEAQWQSEQASQTSHAPEFEPDSVAHLFQYPQSVTASVNHISVNISQQFEVFRSETGFNETPELLKPLEAIPSCLDRIGDILTNHGHNARSEQQLREEIGRLQKRVAQLEAELQQARSDSDGQKTHWFGPALRVIGTSMSAIAISAWVISEDDLGPRERIENILNWTKELSELATGAKPTSPPTLPQILDT
jgi:uncharacterized small protein (DUF1192 family)